MRIVRDYRDLPPDHKGAVAAIGNFDGVHRGHRSVIAQAGRIAAARQAPHGVITFEPHPRAFFNPDSPPFRLSSLLTKSRDLGRLGVQILYALPFDRDFSLKSAEAFVEDVLVKGLGVRHVVIGYDFVFGHRRQGDAAMLESLARRFGFGVVVLDPVQDNGVVYSSTRVRELLAEGQPRQAAEILGHFWTIEGQVEAGDKRGRTIGFPTANIGLGEHLHPALGVYAVRAGFEVDGELRWHDGVANLGRRPTFGKDLTLLEVHFLDFQGDLYGRRLWVEFIDFLRPERKFDGIEALKAQISADAVRARQILAQPNALSASATI